MPQRLDDRAGHPPDLQPWLSLAPPVSIIRYSGAGKFFFQLSTFPDFIGSN